MDTVESTENAFFVFQSLPPYNNPVFDSPFQDPVARRARQLMVPRLVFPRWNYQGSHFTHPLKTIFPELLEEYLEVAARLLLQGSAWV